MPDIVKQDFFIGSAFYAFMRKNPSFKPTLLTTLSDDNFKLFDVTTTDTSRKFLLCIQFTGKSSRVKNVKGRDGKEKKYCDTWKLSISEKCKSDIESFMNEHISHNFYFFFVLGYSGEYCADVAVVDNEKYQKIKHKTSITIKHYSGDKRYEIVDRDGESVYVPTNSLNIHFDSASQISKNDSAVSYNYALSSNNLSKNIDNSSLRRRNLDDNFENCKVKRIEISRKSFDVSSWQHALIELCSFLYRRDKVLFRSLADSDDLKWKKVVLISAKYTKDRTKKIPKTDLYVWTNNSANRMVYFMRLLLKKFSINESEFFIYTD